MNKIMLPDKFQLIYRYSLTDDESYYTLNCYDSEFYEDEFKESHPVGSTLIANGHTYRVISLIYQFGLLFVGLKVIN